jgi:hypothetical protein
MPRVAEVRGGIFWYVEAFDTEVASEVLIALDGAGLALSDPTLKQPTYLSGEPGHEGDAVATDVKRLARHVSVAATGLSNSLSFQLWVDPTASVDVVCSVSRGHGGLTCLAFSFDGLDSDEVRRVEHAVMTVRCECNVKSSIWIVDYAGIDPPHVSPLAL